MIATRSVLYCFLLSALAVSIQQPAEAHGGVVEEDDLCVIKVNYLRAHFKIYSTLTGKLLGEPKFETRL